MTTRYFFAVSDHQNQNLFSRLMFFTVRSAFNCPSLRIGDVYVAAIEALSFRSFFRNIQERSSIAKGSAGISL